ncbi:MAG: hypothetical protein AVDCRST_MAG67-2001, partial [uncultured Solirubrobacteraceae bacterium]
GRRCCPCKRPDAHLRAIHEIDLLAGRSRAPRPRRRDLVVL